MVNGLNGKGPGFLVAGGNGETTIVDVKELHPENEGIATLQGAVAGGGLGAAAGVAPYINDIDHLGGKEAAIIGAAAIVGAAVGGAIKRAKVKTHNNWSDRVMKDTLEANKAPESKGR